MRETPSDPAVQRLESECSTRVGKWVVTLKERPTEER